MAKGCHRFRYREISVEITGSGQYSSLEVVNAMTNEAKNGYDSAIEQLIAFELALVDLELLGGDSTFGSYFAIGYIKSRF